MTSAGVPEKLGCATLPLSHRQRDLCRRKPHLLPSIQDGARLAIAECHSQFRHERWNCSTSDQPAVFGYELTSGEVIHTTSFLLREVCPHGGAREQALAPVRWPFMDTIARV